MTRRASTKLDASARYVAEGEEWLRAGRHAAAESSFLKCPATLDAKLAIRCSLGLAEAILGQSPSRDLAQKAYSLLVRAWFNQEVTKSRRIRRRLLDLLCASAEVGDLDLELIDWIWGREPVRVPPGKIPSLLKAFYFGHARTGKTTLGERAVIARRLLEDRLHEEPTLVANAYTLQFAKAYSSSTPLQDLAGDTVVGGGYFLALDGYGCVIDPGHHFLENLYRLPRTLADINCIIVTHFHDDHYANLPALLSLLFQRFKKEGRQVRLLLDAQTNAVFRPLIDPNNSKSPVSRDSMVLEPNNDTPVLLRDEFILRTLPTKHDVFGSHTGVGLHLEIPRRRRHLVITGDTGWTAEMVPVYARFRGMDVMLVAHVSSARPDDELFGTLTTSEDSFYGQHLCIHGLSKLIETVRPRQLILSEIGEELKDAILDLQQMIGCIYGDKMEVGLGNHDAGTYHL